MARSDQPVGPFPSGSDPEAYDRFRRRVLWSMPSGLYVLGSRAGSRRNLMTVNWATQVATAPKLVAVSIEVAAVTHGLVREGGAFALSILRRQDRALVRRFVKPLRGSEPAAGEPAAGEPAAGEPADGERTAARSGSRAGAVPGDGGRSDGRESGELAGFALVPTTTGCPALEVAGAWIDCTVRQVVPCGSHDLFVGEVVDCGGEPEGLEALRMEDTRMSYGG